MPYTKGTMLPPTIPTSFSPRPTAAPGRPRSGSTNVLDIFAYVVFLAVTLLAVGVFFYGRILATTKVNEDAALAKAEQGIDPSTAEAFVQLSNRLTYGEKLLAGHVAFTSFFSALTSLLPSTVRLTALHLSVDDMGVVKVQGSGDAKDFNSLASASASLSSDSQFEDVIFSGMSVNPRDNTVSFSLSASLDPKSVAFSATTPPPTMPTPTAVASSSSAAASSSPSGQSTP